MYTSTLLDLREKFNWDPVQLTRGSFRWPVALSEVRIEDLVRRQSPASLADVGAPVITPANIDVQTGAIRRRARNYQGAVFQIGTELRDGDILIARSLNVPALLVTERLRGSLVSERFIALRPEDPQVARWIWAILNSESGIRMRAHLMAGSETPTIAPANLLRARIPLPPQDLVASIAKIVDSIERITHSTDEEPSETWWTTADLRIVEWRIALATPDPSQLAGGIPFGEFCAEITRGHNTRRDAIGYESFGLLPVADVSMLGGKPPQRWLPSDADNQVIARPGDLLVAAVGNYAYATTVDSPIVVDQNVYRVRLRNSSFSGALADFLNSANGFGVRRILLSGVTVPSLSKGDFARIPIPPQVLTDASDRRASQLPPLAQRLEQALWQN